MMNITLKDWLIIAIVMTAGLTYIAMADEPGSASEQNQIVSFESTQNQTALLELYTSEGCSSCPPADRWLSSLLDEDDLWLTFIPIALHVDYWDYIGWKDPFANADHSARQRQYAREQSLKTVYTPGFVYNGKEWRNWYVKRYLDFPKGDRPGVLKLKLDGQQANLEFTPTEFTRKKLKANLALLGFNLETDVRAGENRGKKLPHDFVVLGMNQADLKTDKNQYLSQLDIPTSTIKTNRYAIVAWINDSDNQMPVQTVGGWLP
ncbi:MAG: hypothetical protein ACI909_002602 [Planctomycetota bacterium]|jgi:hypothetical protein